MKPQESFGWRYEIHDTLGRGNMGVVYHAVDRYSEDEVALKAIHASDTSHDFGLDSGIDTDHREYELRLALAREFRSLASLKHPNIIGVMDYGFTETSPYFTMELLQDNKSVIEAAKSQEFSGKMQLIGQILQAMIYLHQRNIIHRDLKPDNIQVMGGQAKILDFGLAMARDEIREKMAGTLAYMAPEVLSHNGYSVQTDLYALGMIFFEMLAGEYPFDTDNITALIQSTIYEEIHFDTYFDDVGLITFFEKLLAKQAQDRFETARDALEFCQNQGWIGYILETELIRESYLQAAHFVGRETELQILQNNLKMLHENKGSAWLVGGESGSGKTRLLEELRIEAMVEGCIVLRGQAREASGTPYILMQEPVKHLSFSTTLSKTELNTLLPVIPGLSEQLVKHQQLSQQESSEDSEETESRSKLADVLDAILRRQDKPIVLILEDLHWVRESLPLVKHLANLTKQIPMMVVGSFRNDENPALAAELDTMQSMTLDRLSRNQIDLLTQSMIGDETANYKELTDLLERETEGNIFFIVEVMRVLADQAGQLNQIGLQTLPSKVFSGGIQAVVQRRLDRLPSDMRVLLDVAALTGKKIDLDVVRACNTDDQNIDHWLMICNNASVLELADETWQFTHDKIRTALVSAMPLETKSSLHLAIAKALETIEAPAENPRHALIAYHYENYGDLSAALDAYEKAADLALRHYAIDNVAQYLRRIDDLDNRIEVLDDEQESARERRAHWHRLWGEVADASGDFEQSAYHYTRVLTYHDSLDASELTLSKLRARGEQAELTQTDHDILFASERLLTISLYRGDWEQAEQITKDQASIYFVLGQEMDWVQAMAKGAWIKYFQGKFEDADSHFQRIYRVGETRKLHSLLIAGGTGVMMTAIRRYVPKDELQALVEKTTRSVATYDQTVWNQSVLWNGVLALAYWHLDNEEQAAVYVERTNQLITGRSQFDLLDIEGLIGLVETLLASAEKLDADERPMKSIALTCKSLHIFAQVHPFGRARAWLYQGRENWLKGKERRALSALQMAANQAKQSHMPYDEGVAYMTMATLIGTKHESYLNYLDTAIACFKEVGADNQLQKAQTLKTNISNT